MGRSDRPRNGVRPRTGSVGIRGEQRAEIDTPFLLDILLGLVVLLFIPFGIRRGVAKEAMVSAGILLGATLADRFGAAWGAVLASRFGWSRDATFRASAASLRGHLLLGYGGGAALGPSRPGTLPGSWAGCWRRSTLRCCSPFCSAGSGSPARAQLWTTVSSVTRCCISRPAFAGRGWRLAGAHRLRLDRERLVRDGSRARAAGRGRHSVRQRPVRVANDSDAAIRATLEPISRSGRFGQESRQPPPCR